MSALSIVLSVLTFFVYSVLSLDKCPTPPLQKDFNITQYLGEWHQIESYPIKTHEGLSCVKANYEWANETLSEVSFKITAFDKTSNQNFESNGTAIPKEKSANISINFGNGDLDGLYQVIETDYKYSLVYGCNVSDGLAIEYAWILSKDPKAVNESLVKNLTNILADFGSNTTLLTKTDQEHCSGAAQTTLSFLLLALMLFICKLMLS